MINACILGDLVPVYVYPNMDEKRNIYGISPDDIEKQLARHMVSGLWSSPIPIIMVSQVI